MHRILVALSLALLAAPPLAASDETAVMAPVRQFVSAFNKGDTKTVLAVCSDVTSIIDEFPPYEWHGAGACSTWLNDYDADAKRNGITDGIVTLGHPRHIDITKDRAYVVLPVSYTMRIRGKRAKETGSIFVISLQKGAADWRITGWAWAKH